MTAKTRERPAPDRAFSISAVREIAEHCRLPLDDAFLRWLQLQLQGIASGWMEEEEFLSVSEVPKKLAQDMRDKANALIRLRQEAPCAGILMSSEAQAALQQIKSRCEAAVTSSRLPRGRSTDPRDLAFATMFYQLWVEDLGRNPKIHRGTEKPDSDRQSDAVEFVAQCMKKVGSNVSRDTVRRWGQQGLLDFDWDGRIGPYTSYSGSGSDNEGEAEKLP